MKKNLLSLLTIFLFSFNAFSQLSPISIGSWRMHIPYNKGIQVDEGKNGTIYCATKFGLFLYNKNSGEYKYYNTLSGLSDHQISNIRYDVITDVLVVSYNNSNLDILRPDGSIANLPEIKEKSIVGGKKINDIDMINGLIYLSCEFGIVVIDINREEVKDTYYIGPNGNALNVNSIAYDGTYIYAATDSGIYKGLYSDPTLYNYSSWSKETNLYSPDGMYTSAASLDGKVYVTVSYPSLNADSVLKLENGNWIPHLNYADPGAFIDSKNGKLLYRNSNFFIAYRPDGASVNYLNNYDYPYGSINRGYCDSDNNIWIADGNYGLLFNSTSGERKTFTPNGPNSESVAQMKCINGHLWVASGSITGDVPNYLIKDGIYYFHDNNWHNFSQVNDSIYKYSCNVFSPTVACVAVDPSDPSHAFIGSWGSGLLEYRANGGVAFYSAANSGLSEVSNYPNYLLLGGLEYDSDGNLWCVTGYNNNCVSVKKADGSWMKYTIPDVNYVNYLNFDIVIDDIGQKWFITHQGASTGQGVSVFKEASLNSNAGLHFKKLNDHAGTGALPDMFVRSIAKDKDGAIWLGTDKGVAVIYNPGNVFSGGDFDAQKIIIEQDGYAQYLLETESVTAIAIDGANRKWFGTYSGGVFLMSADGTKQLLNFNIDNSPLPSNLITSISIDGTTGEVFIGTDKGIISYMGDATEGGDECDNYYVFPNPVRHEYSGPIAIRGLINDADVKIVDVAGNLVYHTKANGGEASWNGKKFTGERAETGIYSVFISNEDGSQTCITKFLMAK
ncbi:MAG: two-component regulator propeller domain-containing protein [Bacteroidia bacterium]